MTQTIHTIKNQILFLRAGHKVTMPLNIMFGILIGSFDSLLKDDRQLKDDLVISVFQI